MNKLNDLIKNLPIVYDLFLLLLGAVLAWIIPKIFRVFKSTDIEHCVFNIPYDLKKPERHDIIVKKRFKKVCHIDCPWFNIETIRGFNEFKYPQCPHGKNIKDTNGKTMGTCHFF